MALIYPTRVCSLIFEPQLLRHADSRKRIEQAALYQRINPVNFFLVSALRPVFDISTRPLSHQDSL